VGRPSFQIAAPQRCEGANCGESGRHWPVPLDDKTYRCRINMYLIRMSWLHGSSAVKTGRGQGTSRGAHKTVIVVGT
jgi:hypothetical protein